MTNITSVHKGECPNETHYYVELKHTNKTLKLSS